MLRHSLQRPWSTEKWEITFLLSELPELQFAGLFAKLSVASLAGLGAHSILLKERLRAGSLYLSMMIASIVYCHCLQAVELGNSVC